MPFQFRLLAVLVFKTLFCTRGTDARLTPKRILVLLVLFPAYFLTLLTNWLCLWLDEVLFRGYRRQTVEKPLFIVGPPRTGSTLLHRLLAGDEQFTSMKTWEILFAPSVVQKRFWHGVGALDRLVGRPLGRLVLAFEGWALRDFNRMHHVGLFEPEEDDAILHNVFATGLVALVLPFREEVLPLVFFDEYMPAAERTKVMGFYRRCVQRHLHVFGRDKRFLSKNPTFSFKVVSLSEAFPDAGFICMARTPLETVPSSFSFISYFYDVFCSRGEDSPSRDFIFELLSAWYRYPVSKLRRLPEHQHMIVRYDELVRDPKDVVLGCFERLGYVAGDTTRERLQGKTERARSFKSKHSYLFEELALTPEQIAADYADVIEDFGFQQPS